MSKVHLFTPLKLKHTTIKNRTLMGSMHTGLEDVKGGFEKLAAFYEQRAKADVGLIITGGFAPNFQGRIHPFGSQLSFPWQVNKHGLLTQSVHKHEGKICLQILHAGRYAYHPLCVSASSSKSPISKFKARAITRLEIKKTIFDYTNCAAMAAKAGYDGIEIMGSEGYFLNQFLAPATNKRNDQYGGSIDNRIRLSLEIVKSIRRKLGNKFIIIFRVSLLDLVPHGMAYEEVIYFINQLEKIGVDIINTGIGWHEARIPTIATIVPRAAFAWITQRVKQDINLPIIATNRINTAHDANEIITQNKADMISMARPFLADPKIISKIKNDQTDEINTCIACNQACLDHVFANKTSSCLVNPKACHETEFTNTVSTTAKNLA
ncbi:MAG: NADPH-dependent 2,4-dienoyl-CoA reductase, partial [Halobacteriovoraceae bacterium]|nr:NADPH-dependent 2,4-dienoyl-CoA reductase [Halobacteriovoraceae bacterium]